jgi:hypothetical protein
MEPGADGGLGGYTRTHALQRRLSDAIRLYNKYLREHPILTKAVTAYVHHVCLMMQPVIAPIATT